MKYCVTINDKRYEVEVERGYAAIASTAEVRLGVVENEKLANSQAASTSITPKVIDSSEQTIEVSSWEGSKVIKAPMAGGITEIKVSVGSVVKIGDTLMMLEAMKMENDIIAHVDGTVAEIKVANGTNVSAGDVLVVL